MTLEKQRPHKKGFILIEALLTVSILAIGLTVMIQSLLSSFRATVYAQDYSTAVILLDNKMAELLERGFIDEAMDENQSFPSPYEKFRYHLVTRHIAEGSPSGAINEVQLGVLWPSGRKNNNILVTTYLFQIPK